MNGSAWAGELGVCSSASLDRPWTLQSPGGCSRNGPTAAKADALAKQGSAVSSHGERVLSVHTFVTVYLHNYRVGCVDCCHRHRTATMSGNQPFYLRY